MSKFIGNCGKKFKRVICMSKRNEYEYGHVNFIPKVKPIGLPNTSGVSCYMNTLLQLLLNSRVKDDIWISEDSTDCALLDILRAGRLGTFHDECLRNKIIRTGMDDSIKFLTKLTSYLCRQKCGDALKSIRIGFSVSLRPSCDHVPPDTFPSQSYGKLITVKTSLQSSLGQLCPALKPFNCRKCGKEVRKKQVIVEYPPVLMLMLNNVALERDNEIIEMEISYFDEETKMEYMYEFLGCAVHSGSLPINRSVKSGSKSGHYVAFVKDKFNHDTFWRCSDSSVSGSDRKSVARMLERCFERNNTSQCKIVSYELVGARRRENVGRRMKSLIVPKKEMIDKYVQFDDVKERGYLLGERRMERERSMVELSKRRLKNQMEGLTRLEKELEEEKRKRKYSKEYTKVLEDKILGLEKKNADMNYQNGMLKNNEVERFNKMKDRFQELKFTCDKRIEILEAEVTRNEEKWKLAERKLEIESRGKRKVLKQYEELLCITRKFENWKEIINEKTEKVKRLKKELVEKENKLRETEKEKDLVCRQKNQIKKRMDTSFLDGLERKKKEMESRTKRLNNRLIKVEGEKRRIEEKNLSMKKKCLELERVKTDRSHYQNEMKRFRNECSKVKLRLNYRTKRLKERNVELKKKKETEKELRKKISEMEDGKVMVANMKLREKNMRLSSTVKTLQRKISDLQNEGEKKSEEIDSMLERNLRLSEQVNSSSRRLSSRTRLGRRTKRAGTPSGTGISARLSRKTRRPASTSKRSSSSRRRSSVRKETASFRGKKRDYSPRFSPTNTYWNEYTPPNRTITRTVPNFSHRILFNNSSLF